MAQLCNDCEYKKKLKYSTYFECTKYDEVLTANPAEMCVKCQLAKQSRKKSTKKDDFIEVK